MSDARKAGDIPRWTLGDRLTKARHHAGLSVDALADELGVHRNTVGNYENDHSVPKKAALAVWALKTGVPYEWLANGREPEDGPDDGGTEVRNGPTSGENDNPGQGCPLLPFPGQGQDQGGLADAA